MSKAHLLMVGPVGSLAAASMPRSYIARRVASPNAASASSFFIQWPRIATVAAVRFARLPASETPLFAANYRGRI